MIRRKVKELLTHVFILVLAMGIELGSPVRAELIHVERPSTIFSSESGTFSVPEYHSSKLISDSAVQSLGLLNSENLPLSLSNLPNYSLDDPCSASRFGGPAQYLDTLTSAVFQYYGAASNLSFPFTASQLDFGLYFMNNGSATDSIRLLVGVNCTSFGQICCTPRFQDCYGAIDIHRGSPFPTLLQLSIDLSNLDCCFNEGFWLSVVVEEVYSGETPSFLFSARSNDPNPLPACEQWLITNGILSAESSGDMGWASLAVSGECGDCGEVSAVDCSTINPGLDLNCNSYTQINCGTTATELENQSNVSYPSNVSSYCCSAWDESGPERLFSVEVPENGNLLVELFDVTGGDVDLFVLDSCSAGNCLAAADSMIQLIGLPGGRYFIVVDGFAGNTATFGIRFTCLRDCNALPCPAEVRFGSPAANRYLDGEWDRALGQMYYSYYTGSGNSQIILGGDPEACELQPVIEWTAIENAANRLLAADPRNGGQFWCGTVTDYELGTGHLYLVNYAGAVVRSWNAIANLPYLRWSGGAFDPDHNHLWVFIRDSVDAGGSRAYELDVSNDASPIVIQGPHPIPQLSPYISLSTGGSDYSDEEDIVTVVHQGYPHDFIECYADAEAGYGGPPPGPGLLTDAWCPPDSNRIQGFGVVAYDEGGDDGELLMMNFTDNDFYHPLNVYAAPTRLRPPDCPAVDNLIARKSGSNINLRWRVTETGIFRIYSSINPDNDGNPDDGDDPDFSLRTTIVGSGSLSWTDLSGTAEYKNYVIVRYCP